MSKCFLCAAHGRAFFEDCPMNDEPKKQDKSDGAEQKLTDLSKTYINALLGKTSKTLLVKFVRLIQLVKGVTGKSVKSDLLS